MLTLRLLTATDPQRKIHTIKNLRAATGLGLKESKDIVDSLTNPFPPATLPEIRVAEQDVALIADYFTYENLTGRVPDAAKLALRAALTRVSPETLESLAAGLTGDSETRLVLTEAAGLIRMAVSS